MGIIPIAIILIYGYLGHRLKKNPIIWGFIGLGLLISIPLLMGPLLFFFHNPSTSLIFWTLIILTSILFTLTVAFVVAYKNKLFSNKKHTV
jgi:hypothetical protein